MPLRIVFMGTPQDAALLLESLVRDNNPPVAVVTQKDQPRGRGLRVEPTPVKRVALAHRIPVYQPNTWRDPEPVRWLRGMEPDLVLVAAYGHILPEEVLRVPKLGCFNVHASLLPKYRGPEPVRAAILAAESETGVTIFKLDAGIDTGPIALQEKVTIQWDDDAGTLTRKIFHKGVEVLPKFLEEAGSGSLALVSQKNAHASHSRKFTNADARLDWSSSAAELVLHVRAFSPEPGAYTFWRGKRIKIFRAQSEGNAIFGEVGKVSDIHARHGIGVTTGRGILWIRELQLEGKKQLPAGDFLRGTRDFTPPQVLGESE